MIRGVLIILFVVLIFMPGCNERKNSYLPIDHLTTAKQERIKEEIIRYVAKAPRRVISDIKFDTTYDEHYATVVKQYDLMAYFISKNNEHFFLVARIAPSMEEKLVATGGRMKFDDDFNLTEYEEVFRTWKMKRQDLEERATYLFDLMVKGEDLTPYYTATAGFNYIEFPDDHVFFDKQTRTWKSDQYTSVEEMVYESRDLDSLIKK